LFAKQRYDELVGEFLGAAARVSGLARLPRLTAFAVAALASLKTQLRPSSLVVAMLLHSN
jgi:hypothetical protein